MPLQLRGAVAVIDTAAGGSFLGSGLVRALCYIVGQLYSAINWCSGSWCVAKLPCAASNSCSLLFRRQCPCSCDSEHAECRGHGLHRIQYPVLVLRTPALLKSITVTVLVPQRHCTESNVVGSVLIGAD